MPFLSKAQRRFMHAQHPDIAARWEGETPKNKALPERLSPTKNQKALSKLKRGMAGKKK